MLDPKSILSRVQLRFRQVQASSISVALTSGIASKVGTVFSSGRSTNSTVEICSKYSGHLFVAVGRLISYNATEMFNILCALMSIFDNQYRSPSPFRVSNLS